LNQKYETACGDIQENIIFLHHHGTIGNLTINNIGKKIRIKSSELVIKTVTHKQKAKIQFQNKPEKLRKETQRKKK
jgi:hypothetical protein